MSEKLSEKPSETLRALQCYRIGGPRITNDFIEDLAVMCERLEAELAQANESANKWGKERDKLADELTAARLERDAKREALEKAFVLGDDMARALSSIAKDKGFADNARALDWRKFHLGQIVNKEPTTYQLAEVMGIPATNPPTSVASTNAPTPDPWSAYPPPPGESWHNPDKLTPEQVGVGEWTLLKGGEHKNLHRFDVLEVWIAGKWFEANKNLPVEMSFGFTYRTRAPLPTKPDPEPFALPYPSCDNNGNLLMNDRALAAEANAMRAKVKRLEEIINKKEAQ